MFYILGKTVVSKLFQERMKALGISRKDLKAWAWKQGFSRQEYLQVWENCWGSRVSREPFLLRLAQRMGAGPLLVFVAAAADRAPTPYKDFFLAIREGLERHPAVVRDWQALDAETQQALLQLVRQPEQARCLMRRYRTGRPMRPPGVQTPGQGKADPGIREGAGQGVKGCSFSSSR